jgi:hypothetical protein
MTETIDHHWWKLYREGLEKTFGARDCLRQALTSVP